MARKDIINQNGVPNWDAIAGFKERLDGHDGSLANNSSKIDNRGVDAKAQGFKGDGTTADLTLLTTIINNAPDNSKIIIPNGTYLFNGGLPTLTNGKRLVGIGKPTLDFSLAPDGITAVSIDSKRLPISVALKNFVIKGASKTGTSKGVSLTGSQVQLDNVEIVNFGTGLDLNKSHMYINSFREVWIHQCTTGIQFPDTTPDPAITDCGENLRFHDCNISDCTVGFAGGLTTTDVHFHGCSLDYNVRLCSVKWGVYNFYGGHLETNITTSPQDYYIDAVAGNSPSFSFHGTTISCYGIHNFFNPDTALRGSATFHGCGGFGRGTGDASDSAMRSQMKVVIAPGQTTATVKHFLASSQFSMVSVKNYILGGQTYDITTFAVTPTVKLTQNTNTLTITIPSAQASNTFIMLDFG